MHHDPAIGVIAQPVIADDMFEIGLTDIKIQPGGTRQAVSG